MKAVRNPYQRHRVQTPIFGESMTHQSHAESCDINNIIRRYDNTGTLPPAAREAQYGDVTDLQVDLTERINTSRETLDKAGRALAEHEESQKNAQTEKMATLEAEIAALKAAQNSGETSPPDPAP